MSSVFYEDAMNESRNNETDFNLLYKQLYRSSVEAVSNIILAGGIVKDITHLNNDMFDCMFTKLGIDLKTAQFLVSIFDHFSHHHRNLMEMFGVSKAVALASMNYSILEPHKFPVGLQTLKSMTNQDLLDYLFDTHLESTEQVQVPYLQTLAMALAVQYFG